MSRRLKISELVPTILHKAHELTKFKSPPYWVAVSEIEKALDGPDKSKMGEAVQWAVDRHLLDANGGVPARIVRVTVDGIARMEKRKVTNAQYTARHNARARSRE